MSPTRWASAADKHGIGRADALHAMRNARIYVPSFDAPRVEGRPWADLFIGPSRDGAVMVEVLAHVDAKARDVLIFHVMVARRRTVERARRVIEERRKR